MTIRFLQKSILPVLLLLAGSLQAQNPANESGDLVLSSDMLMIIVLSVSVFCLLMIAFMLWQLSQMIAVMKASGAIKADAKPLIDFTKAVPIEREHEVMLDHDYDGIKELDNRLPPWWVWGFYITILFAVVYLWYYHLSDGPSSDQEYRAEVEVAEVQLKKLAELVNEENVKVITDAARLDKGKAIFVQNCVQCHGAEGQGGIGPNLTDDKWIHGGGIKNIFTTVKKGVAGRMVAWSNQLSPSQMQEVSSYVITLQGTKPLNPKAPEGEIVWTKDSK